jgi:hypothetical protein
VLRGALEGLEIDVDEDEAVAVPLDPFVVVLELLWK